MGRAALPIVTLVAVFAGDLARAAEPVALKLRDESGVQCPGELTLRGRVVELLGEDPFVPDADRRLEVRLRSDAEGLLADVRLLDPDGAVRGARQMRARDEDCDALVAAVALYIVLAIDPVRGLALMARPGSPPPEPPPKPPPEPPPEPPTEPIQVIASLGPRLGLGATPGVALGGSAAVGLRRDPWSLALDARLFLPSARDLRGGEVSLDLRAAGLAGCLCHARYAGCAVVVAGWQHATGATFAVNRTGGALFFAPGARGQVDVPLSARFFARFAVELLAPLGETKLLVDGRSVWDTAPVTADFSAAAGVRF